MKLKISDTSKFINEEVIRTIEKFIGYKFPKDYKFFLIEYNGGYLDSKNNVYDFKEENKNGSIISCLFGITYKDNLGLLAYLHDRERYPDNMLPIGNDCLGNRILMSVKGIDRNKIYHWDHEMEADTENGKVADYSNLTLIADSFEEFITNLKDESELDLEQE